MLQIQAKGTAGGALAVGVSNFLPHHLKDLEAASLPLPAVNQVEFSPFVWDSALPSYCHSKGITLMAYSPLHKNGDVLRHPAIRSAANARGLHLQSYPAMDYAEGCATHLRAREQT